MSVTIDKLINESLQKQDFDKLSSSQMKRLLKLKYSANAQKIINLSAPSQIVDVIGVLTTFDSYDEALSYLADSTDYMNMVKYSPGNRNALESVRIKRDILSRDAPSAKTGYGKCPKCGNADLLGTTQQLRGGDEGMALLLSCPIASCGFRAKR